MGFLYEWLTGNILEMETAPGSNYVDFLDPSKYIVGTSLRNSRWKINDNLLGTPEFCPIVRRTQALSELLSIDISAELEQLKAGYAEEIFNRATQYLYRKETKSSYEIEQEKPSPDRMNRFIAILYDAGKQPANQLLTEQNLTSLQNAIVDPRYVQSGYRSFQNYIGQRSYRMEEIYHYVCPPPGMVHSMMNGILAVEEKTRDASPVIRATLISFGFVFIHPFLDGNGRIHRFLIHDMLTRDGMVSQGSIIPVSAHMVNNLKDYDLVLEAYSKPLMQRIQFVSDANGELTVTNPDEIGSYFRYPELTAQCIYLANTLRATIRHDLSEELLFLERYDELKRELQQLIDMPDKRLDEIIVFLHQNKGIFPNRRKKQFQEITDAEFSGMEDAYREIFTK
ncbi:Fic family protein [Parapedobacter soli]|uniref:Fic family protein n=1 Tax=Parapedobacter soli TaxID=416955 RepID=UPI0021C5AC3C|nr:Fic family protein [Parapedobacter soli]